jgi:FtsP/CotA-like multicopper oxidase with cupredoxin domain
MLQGAAGATLVGGGGPLLAAAATSASGPDLWQPATVRALPNGTLTTQVTAGFARYRLGNRDVTLRSYDGGPMGRTLRLPAGGRLNLRLNNNMPYDPTDATCTTPGVGIPDNVPRGFNVTNMHVHGLHVSPRAPSDDIFIALQSKQSFNYSYEIPEDHPCGTFFYHAHFHGSTALQVSGGMAGALIIEGPIDTIPEIAAAEEKVIVLQAQRFNADGYCDDYAQLLLGTKIYINGQDTPVIRMRPGAVQRWRMVNATHNQFVTLSIEGEQNIVALCYDGLPLPAAQPTEAVRLVPGNRADLLVQATREGVFAIRGPDPGNVEERILAYLVVEGPRKEMALFSGPLPSFRELEPIAEKSVTFGRRLLFGYAGAPTSIKYTINERPFSCTDPWRIALGSVEEWEIYNQTFEPHPFHIHVNPFQMVAGGGVKPGVWLDTVEIPPYERIRFRTRFSTFTGTFVFHCHTLTHEDTGMMQGLEVVEGAV